jgi:hypothetical protein
MPTHQSTEDDRQYYLAAAVVCWLAPLAVGTIIFITWLVTRQSVLMAAGYFVIVGGIFATALGLASLMGLAVYARKRRLPFIRPAMVLGLLLLSNFPVAGAMVMYAVDEMDSFRIAIVNRTTESVTVQLLDTSGQVHEFRDVSPDSQSNRKVRFQGQGSVMYRVHSKSHEVEGDFLGYVTNGMGGDATLEIGPDGTIRIREKTQRID